MEARRHDPHVARPVRAWLYRRRAEASFRELAECPGLSRTNGVPNQGRVKRGTIHAGATVAPLEDRTMTETLPAFKMYRYLAERSGSSYRELFVCGTALRAQSFVGDLENEGLTPEEVAATYHIPLEAVHEAVAYVHANEELLTKERFLTRQEAIAKGYLRSRCLQLVMPLVRCMNAVSRLISSSLKRVSS